MWRTCASTLEGVRIEWHLLLKPGSLILGVVAVCLWTRHESMLRLMKALILEIASKLWIWLIETLALPSAKIWSSTTLRWRSRWLIGKVRLSRIERRRRCRGSWRCGLRNRLVTEMRRRLGWLSHSVHILIANIWTCLHRVVVENHSAELILKIRRIVTFHNARRFLKARSLAFDPSNCKLMKSAKATVNC